MAKEPDTVALQDAELSMDNRALLCQTKNELHGRERAKHVQVAHLTETR
jgi:hypothetical protein